MSSEDGNIADILSQLRVQGGFKSIREAVTKGGAIGTPTLYAIAWEVSGGQAGILHTDIEIYIQAWGVAADMAARLDCPHYQKPDTNGHYRHFCLAPTVVAARREHHKLLAAANIHLRTQEGGGRSARGNVLTGHSRQAYRPSGDWRWRL